MAIQTTTKITIKGKPISHFERLFLSQSVTDHHFFEITLRLDHFETQGIVLQKTQDLIGEQITINTSVLEGLGNFTDSVFTGIVTEISNNLGNQGNKNRITIKGYSPTILTDNSPNCTSYIQKPLSEIVKDVLSDYPVNLLKKQIQPTNSTSLPYTVQYNETDFGFLNRLAHINGEWFYYNGTSLIFGQEATDSVNLAYGYDLHEFNLSVSINNPKFTFLSNDYLQNQEEKYDSSSVEIGMNGLNGAALLKAEKVFTKTPTSMHNQYFSERQTKHELEQKTTIQKKAKVGKMVVLKGSSDNPGLKVGGVISIQDQLQNGPQPFGEYRITSISHQCNSMGHYTNSFEAVPVAVLVPPYSNTSVYPRSESQSAIVIDNKDPEGLKRLKVQFTWQKSSGEVTPWIRMVTPHAGNEKGFYFVPEIGEEVMIDFEGGNAEKPFIIGTRFNSQQKSSFYDKDNNIKAIQSRSGHLIKLDDKNGNETITITDKKGNQILIDTENENITVSALETMTFNAKNMVMNVGENIQVNAGKNISASAGENISESAGQSINSNAGANIGLTAQSSFSATGSQTAALKGGSGVSIGGNNISVNGGSSIKIASGNTDVR